MQRLVPTTPTRRSHSRRASAELERCIERCNVVVNRSGGSGGYYSEYPFVREAVAGATRGTQNHTGVSFNRGYELERTGTAKLRTARLPIA